MAEATGCRDGRGGAIVLDGTTPPPTQDAFLTQIPDVDGNHKPDVLDTRTNGDSSSTVLAGITVRDGQTGRPLWSRTYSATGGSVTVTPTRLGKAGQPALLVVDPTSSSSGGTETVSFAYMALAANTGKQLWRRTFTGTLQPMSEDLPLFGGFLHATHGPATDILILRGVLTNAASFTSRASVVSGRDGSVRHYPGSDEATGAGASFFPVGDISGDGLADVVMTEPATSVIEALQGSSGKLVWKTTKVRLKDLALAASGRLGSAQLPAVVVETVVSTTRFVIRVVALRGSNGHELWSRDGNFLFPLHRVGPRGQHDALVARVIEPTGSSTIAMQLVAVDVSGKVLYHHRVAATTASPPSGGGVRDFAMVPVGDVQPDGTTDFRVQLTTGSREVVALVSGRTGGVHALNFDTGADGSLHKGAGTDLLAVTLRAGVPTLTARRGSTRRRYYSRVIAGLHQVQGAWVNGLRVSGNTCSDISLATAAEATDSLAVLSARGTRLWSIDFSPSQMTGGERVVAARPRHFCV